MKLRDYYLGSNDPFEGDHTLWLRSLPANAQVTKATITLETVELTEETRFEETITFTNNHGDFGAERIPGTDIVEVDFHARRTLASVEGSNLTGANLQVDMGGIFVDINERGTIKGPYDVPFSLKDDNKLPSLAVNKFKLTNEDIEITAVTIRTVPTNVSLRMGQMPPFWTRTGELATAETSTDFASVLNTFLTESHIENGFYVIPLVIHSDTIARLNVNIAIDYMIEKPILPSHLLEVKLSYGYSSMPGEEEGLLTLKLPREARPVAGTGGAIQGTFDTTRVLFGEIGESRAIGTVNVSQEHTMAQPIKLTEETPVSGIDLPLANTKPGLSGLHMALQGDADGKPSGEVLTSADVTVEKPTPGQSTWGSAALPAEFRFMPGNRYWLVLQSVSGEAYWDVGPGDPAEAVLQSSTDGGLSWRTAATKAGKKPLAALFRLRHSPERFKIPVQLQIGTGPEAMRVRFDHFAPIGRVEFDVNFDADLGKYLNSQAVVSPYRRGNLLKNSNFTDPPHDDATRKLFGFDADYAEATNSHGGSAIIGIVDLSRGINLCVERYITLAANFDLDNNINPPVHIDCAGIDPSHTSLEEIIRKINSTMGKDIAFETDDGGGFLGIRSPYEYIENIGLFPWCTFQIPYGWEGTTGLVQRFKIPDGTDRIITILADPKDLKRLLEINLDESGIVLTCFPRLSPETEVSISKGVILSQCVPVVSNCSYLFQFIYGVLKIDPSAPQPRWEVIWLDEENKALSTHSDTIEVESRIKDEELLLYLLSTHSDTIEVESRIKDEELLLYLYKGYETKLTAPSGAVQAEIRFIQDLPGILWLESVLFSPTLETVGNTTFTLRDNNKPLKWQQLSGWSATNGQVLVLDGAGPEDAVVAQTTDVIAGEKYRLQVRAWPLSTPLDDQEIPVNKRARLELHWLNDGPIGEPVILPLDGRDFPKHAWIGNAPEGATQAEIRLIQSRGEGKIAFESVSLLKTDMVSVPLIFLAETTGELMVSNLRVVYDLPEPPTSLILPPLIISQATLKVQSLAFISAQPVSTPPTTPEAIQPVPTPPTTPEAIQPVPTPPTTTEAIQPVQPATLPLTTIEGIGDARAGKLMEFGIDTLEKLATAKPEDVSRMLRGISVETAEVFIMNAKKLMESE